MQCNVTDGIIDLEPVNCYKLKKRISSCYLDRYIMNVMNIQKQTRSDVCILKKESELLFIKNYSSTNQNRYKINGFLDLQKQLLCTEF